MAVLKSPWLKFILFLLVLAGVAAAFYLVPRKRPFSSYTQRAEEAYQKKNFNRAIELNLKALKLYPNHERTPEILLSIGDTYNFSLGNIEKAGKAYEMLTARFPHTGPAGKGFQHAGEMYEKNEQYQNALLAYQGIVDNFPKADEVDTMRFKVAMMALKLKKFEPARRSLMAIVEKNPETPIADQVLFQIGSIFFMEGAVKESVQVLQVAVEKFPDSPLATEMKFTLANGYEEMGELEKALKIYQEIRPVYPNPKVVGKKIEKLTERSAQAKAFRKEILKKSQAGKPPLPPGAEKTKNGTKPAAQKSTAKPPVNLMPERFEPFAE